jgi:hypothetical protein
MSKYNNVNPDHYKLAGRERPGKAVGLKFKAKSTEAAERERWAHRKPSEAGREKTEGREAEGHEPDAESQNPDVQGEQRGTRSRE